MLPNCAVRPKREKRFFVADQIDTLVDHSSLRWSRPFERVSLKDLSLQVERSVKWDIQGYMLNRELEEQIWERVFGKCGSNVSEAKLLH